MLGLLLRRRAVCCVRAAASAQGCFLFTVHRGVCFLLLVQEHLERDTRWLRQGLERAIALADQKTRESGVPGQLWDGTKVNQENEKISMHDEIINRWVSAVEALNRKRAPSVQCATRSELVGGRRWVEWWWCWRWPWWWWWWGLTVRAAASTQGHCLTRILCSRAVTAGGPSAAAQQSALGVSD